MNLKEDTNFKHTNSMIDTLKDTNSFAPEFNLLCFPSIIYPNVKRFFAYIEPIIVNSSLYYTL